ncbi:MAG: HAD family phosphatase [Candidatus Marinimicrobia bacterium]|nr:HAD family phosphatase [Candidatus Neomarinimicrobiota bacterium]
MNHCKLILFDLDGVTIDTEPLYAKGEIKLFLEYGVTIPEEDWKLFRGCTEESFYTLSMNRYSIDEDREVFMKKGRRYVRDEFEKSLGFMPGFKNLIQKLNGQYSIGLVTASPEYMFKWLDERLNLSSIFEHIVYGGMTKKGKPNPEPYLLGMKQFNIEPQHTMVVEDSVHGIQAGLNANAKVVALTGSVEIEDMPAAHKIINSLDEIDSNFINSLFNSL